MKILPQTKFTFQQIRIDLLLLATLTIAAGITRFIGLADIPPGLHGDEAWTALDALKILKEGSIPPYVGSALGQPTGPVWITAAVFSLFGESISLLRLSMALPAVMTIPLFYIFLRLHFSKSTAALTAGMFCFSLFHLHFSRIAFMVITLPFFQLLTLILFLESRKQNSLLLAGLSGIAAGWMMYSYNTAWFVLPVYYLIAALDVIRTGGDRLRVILRLTMFSLFLGIVASPLLGYIIFTPQQYFAHHKTYSLLNLPEVRQAASPLRAGLYVLGYGAEKTRIFFFGGKFDGVDGFGYTRPFPLFVLALAVLGCGVALVKRKTVYLAFFLSMIIGLSPLILTQDGWYRRQMGMLIYLFFFMALGIDTLREFFTGRKGYLQAVILIAALFITASSFQTLKTYFLEFPLLPNTHFVFRPAMVEPMAYISSLTPVPNPVILFTSNACSYETSRWLLRKTTCIDGPEAMSALPVMPGVCAAIVLEEQNRFINTDSLVPAGSRIQKRVFDRNGISSETLLINCTI